jgi:hypothetical protein
MKPDGEKKILSVVILSLALATIVWVAIGQIEQQRILDSVDSTIWAVDFSPEPLQRDMRLAFALIFAGISVWSRRGTKIAVFLFAGFCLLAELPRLISPPFFAAFERNAWGFHIAAGVICLLALLFWFRNINHLLISSLATFYILFDYFAWYVETVRLKRAAGVPELNPPTLLNNCFHGAHWWHIVLLLAAIVMLIWQAKLIMRQRTNQMITPAMA